jgi:phosphatidate cytidylyltransferase
MSSLGLRLLTSLILVPLVIGAIYVGPIALSVLLSITAVFGARELIRIQQCKGVRLPLWLMSGSAILMIVAAGGKTALDPGEAIVFVVLAGTVAMLARKETAMLSGLPFAVFGAIYLGLLPAHLLGFYGFGSPGIDDARPVYYALGLVWACDTFAYVVGSRIGRHKLWPRVSPSKSREGAVAGAVGSVAFSLIAGSWIPGLDTAERVVAGLLACAFGQIGDLAESMMKREASQKDSGHAIPGHGGILDRLDSLAIGIPVLFYWIRWAVSR